MFICFILLLEFGEMPVNSRKELEVDGSSGVASCFGTYGYFTSIFNK